MFTPQKFRIGLHTGSISDALEVVKHFESCKLKEYTAYGRTAIGWGRDVRPGTYPNGISQDEADNFLEIDLGYFSRQVLHAMGSHATFAGLNCYSSFAYNVGLGQHKPFIEGFLTSTTLKDFLNGDLEAAALSLRDWDKVAGVIVPGLSNRRRCEASLLGGTNAHFLQSHNWLVQ
jgi:lysozyme